MCLFQRPGKKQKGHRQSAYGLLKSRNKDGASQAADGDTIAATTSLSHSSFSPATPWGNL
jgi:hypothetical protein